MQKRFLLLIHDAQHEKKEVMVDAETIEEAMETATRFGWILITKPKKLESSSDHSKTLIGLLSALHRLLEGGLTVQEGLHYLYLHPKNNEQKLLSSRLLDDLKNGKPLSMAVENINGKTPVFLLNLLRLGEQSGRMTETLGNLLRFIDDEKRLNDGIIQALIYPMLTLLMLFGISLAMGIFLLPRMQTILSGIQGTGATSESGTNWTFPIILILIWSIPITLLLLFPHRRLILDSFWEKFPILGQWWLFKDYFVFAYSVELLAQRGYPLDQAIEAGSHNVFFSTSKRRCRLALEQLKQGKPLSELFQKAQFPEEFHHWTSIGEATGNVTSVFSQLKEYYKKRVEDMSEKLKKWIEPMMTVVIGIFLFIFIGIYVVPLFQALETAL